MNTETIDQFLQLGRELQRQSLEEDHARELEIFEAADKLTLLIPIQIASFKRKMEYFDRMLQGAELMKRHLEEKLARLSHQKKFLESQECETDSDANITAPTSPANPTTPEA